MDRININTSLKGFILIDQITEIGLEKIKAVKEYSQAPVYAIIESFAQLGAIHVRYLNKFRKHAFLLKIISCSLDSGESINGKYYLTGLLENSSSHAFSYKLNAQRNNLVQFEGRFMFAVIDYDSEFKKDVLETRYKKVLSYLQKKK